MTEANETNKTNEDLNEELSSDELKSFSGGVSGAGIEIPRVTNRQKKGRNPNDPKGSGSGMSLKDWEKSSDGTVSGGERWMT
ncbi:MULTISPECIES: hypothetical protein [unclassified Prochlorococcus]|uniref:hypothetical protein n=1 Tax=unclassified Prochlorococcus TaxID=2627481 RepID=UPI00053388E6|nr:MULTISPECIES: hypothetical protein [unclassified Prochlorococcus]KGG24828.1 hypothetical protein EV12_2700 [Prochlorococcus sp. MIT 0701]KGG25976.1 hypothetical protein EV13_2750 [Prochlorococcus sp. MIT 0702]KGG30846.1 hypothetical protein EV14_2785 [Prochlorococcus sp. MIT 0703]